MKSDKYLPPEPDDTDSGYALGRAFVSAIPYFGGPILELVQHLIAPPIEKRRQEWMQTVGQAIQFLEEKKGIEIEQLKSNEVFIDTLLQASQIAIRNSQEEKRAALKNALMNVALLDSPDQALIQMFLEAIDTFTVWHIKILSLIDDPTKHLNRQDRFNMEQVREQWHREMNSTDETDLGGGFNRFLENIYPELAEKRMFYPQVIRDLYNRGLVTVADVSNINWNGVLASRSTELGKQLLRFIETPT